MKCVEIIYPKRIWQKKVKPYVPTFDDGFTYVPNVKTTINQIICTEYLSKEAFHIEGFFLYPNATHLKIRPISLPIPIDGTP